jgi:hypothetical protein
VEYCKRKDYPDGNTVNSWEKLKNKYEPVSAPSMVKLDKQSRYSSRKKGQYPEVWITELEEFSVRLVDMGSSIPENQFMINVLNNLPTEYDLQLALLEERIGDKDKPLTAKEITAELSLSFERLKIKSTKIEENEESEEYVLFRGQFKGKCRNCGRIGHKLFQCENSSSHNGGNNGNTTGGYYCSYFRKNKTCQAELF